MRVESLSIRMILRLFCVPAGKLRNGKADKKYQQLPDALIAGQNQERQNLQQKPASERQKLNRQKASDSRTQEVEQRHQRQTQQLSNKHTRHSIVGFATR